MLQETGIPWTEALTRKLVGSVHIAAPTINCALILGIGPPALDNVHESLPHFSWQAFAMSQVCLLSPAFSAFICHNDRMPFDDEGPRLDNGHDSLPHFSWQTAAMSQACLLCLISLAYHISILNTGLCSVTNAWGPGPVLDNMHELLPHLSWQMFSMYQACAHPGVADMTLKGGQSALQLMLTAVGEQAARIAHQQGSQALRCRTRTSPCPISPGRPLPFSRLARLGSDLPAGAGSGSYSACNTSTWRYANGAVGAVWLTCTICYPDFPSMPVSQACAPLPVLM